MLALASILLAWAALASSCSSSPANVAGSYTVNLTDDQNGCMFDNWTGTTMGVPLDITQNGTAVTATVGGLAGAYFDGVFGSHVMVGNVSGSHLDVVIHGTRQTTPAGTSCMVSLDADATVDLSGDSFQNGIIHYSYVTNHDTTCPIYTQSCTSTQLFNGSRPPTTH